MERLQFEGYKEFACEIADKFDTLDKENFDDVSVIARPNEIKEVFRELVCLGYDLCNITYERIDWDGYEDEYILSLSPEGIWVKKFKRENGYIEDESSATYIMDNCSSAVIPYCKSENLYEVSIGDIDNSENDDEESETEHTYTVNRKTVDKETFNNYVSKFAPDLVTNDDNTTEDSDYSVTVKVSLDTEEAEEMIRDMERNLNRHVSNMFDMLYRPYLYEYSPHPIRFFW